MQKYYLILPLLLIVYYLTCIARSQYFFLCFFFFNNADIEFPRSHPEFRTDVPLERKIKTNIMCSLECRPVPLNWILIKIGIYSRNISLYFLYFLSSSALQNVTDILPYGPLPAYSFDSYFLLLKCNRNNHKKQKVNFY